MKILIMDLDSKIPNYALKKIEKYHLNRNDEIIWNFPLARYSADKVYVSCIFTKNKDLCKEWENDDKVLIGGSGYDIEKKLPDEIEKTELRINLGFTTRGCIRNCDFCIVRKKEGGISVVGDIYDIWDRQSKEIELLDNNILAIPEHFKKIWGQIKRENLKVKENGLDIRLLTQEYSDILASVRHYEYHFAFDNIKDKDKIVEKIKLLQKSGIKESIFYIIVGFNSTFEEDMERILLLRELGQLPYIMRFETVYNDKKYVQLARWVNQPHMFKTGMSFEDFLIKSTEDKTNINEVEML